ncbi:hypothetical protein D3C76_1399680 [compost metagenome]
MIQHIQHMHRLVDQEAAALRRPLAAPVLGAVIFRRPVPGENAAQAQHPPQLSLADPFLGLFHGRVEAVLEDDAAGDARLLHRPDDLPRFCRI